MQYRIADLNESSNCHIFIISVLANSNSFIFIVPLFIIIHSTYILFLPIFYPTKKILHVISFSLTMTRTTPSKRCSTRLTDAQLDHGLKKCIEFCVEHQRDRHPNKIDPFSMCAKTFAKSTRDKYRRIWNEMFKFFILTEQWQCAILVNPHFQVSNPYPFTPKGVVTYINYRIGKKSTEERPNYVHNYGTKLIMSNGEGLHVLGGWYNPSSLKDVHSTVMLIHEGVYADTCGGPYSVQCKQCATLNSVKIIEDTSSIIEPISDLTPPIELEEFDDADDDADSLPLDALNEMDALEEQEVAPDIVHDNSYIWKSCIKHANNPLLISQGCIMRHFATKKYFNETMKVIRLRYIRKGCGQLQPMEVRTIRKTLLSDDSNFANLQLWVMILLGIKLYLRADELLNMRVEDFIDSWAGTRMHTEGEQPDRKSYLTERQIVFADKVATLFCEVQGKTDHIPVMLTLFWDDEYPEFCPIRVLLWYLKIFNIKSGFLFPPVTELERCRDTPDIEVRCTEPLPYITFLRHLKRVIKEATNRDLRDFTIGTHTLRKTAYLFAVWSLLRMLDVGGFGNTPSDTLVLCDGIVKSARHSDKTNVSTYTRDCLTTYAINQVMRNTVSNNVGKFRSIRIDHGSTDLYTNEGTSNYQQDIPYLALWFFSFVVKIPESHDPKRKQSLLKSSCSLQPENESTNFEDIATEIRKHCRNENSQSLIRRILKWQENVAGERLSSYVNTIIPEVSDVDTLSVDVSAIDVPTDVETPNDAMTRLRTGFLTLNRREKIDTLFSMNTVITESGKNKVLNKHLKYFKRNNLVCKHIQNCYGNDINAFLLAHTNDDKLHTTKYNKCVGCHIRTCYPNDVNNLYEFDHRATTSWNRCCKCHLGECYKDDIETFDLHYADYSLQDWKKCNKCPKEKNI